MLQPEPRSGEGCNTLLPEGLANVNAHGKECYIVIVIYLSYNKNYPSSSGRHIFMILVSLES